MKRTRYDSEYERVRRDAGLGAAQLDLPEEPDANGQMAPDRVEAALGDFKQRMGALEAQDAAAAAERKAKADDLTARANASVLIHEYAAQGVRPPLTDGHGVPTVSLAMLLQLGWTIQRVGEGLGVLLRPEPKPEPPPRKRMEDYDQST
jgi:hypothetical protein